MEFPSLIPIDKFSAAVTTPLVVVSTLDEAELTLLCQGLDSDILGGTRDHLLVSGSDNSSRGDESDTTLLLRPVDSGVRVLLTSL